MPLKTIDISQMFFEHRLNLRSCRMQSWFDEGQDCGLSLGFNRSQVVVDRQFSWRFELFVLTKCIPEPLSAFLLQHPASSNKAFHGAKGA